MKPHGEQNLDNPEKIETLESEESVQSEISEEEAKRIFDSILELDDTADQTGGKSDPLSFKGLSASF